MNELLLVLMTLIGSVLGVSHYFLTQKVNRLEHDLTARIEQLEAMLTQPPPEDPEPTKKTRYYRGVKN